MHSARYTNLSAKGIATCILFLCMGIGQRGQPQTTSVAPTWKSYHPDTCAATISLPGSPTLYPMSDTSDDDGFKTRMYMASALTA
jgi:hypothetical protein